MQLLVRFNARTEGLAVRGDYGAGDDGERGYIFANESLAITDYCKLILSPLSLFQALSLIYLTPSPI